MIKVSVPTVAIAAEIMNIRPLDIAAKAIKAISDGSAREKLLFYAAECYLFALDKALRNHTNLSYAEWKRMVIQDVLSVIIDDHHLLQDISKKIINITPTQVFEEGKKILDTKTTRKVEKLLKKDCLAFLPRILDGIVGPGTYLGLEKQLIQNIIEEVLE